MFRIRYVQILMVAALSLSFLLVLIPPAYSQSTNVCLTCHSNRSMTMNIRGRKVSLFVDRARLSVSVHASMKCVDCHKGYSPGRIPHAEVIRPVDCQACHDIKGFEGSVHGIHTGSTGKSGRPVAGCKDCHGTHEIRSSKDPKSVSNRLNVTGMCAKCHKFRLPPGQATLPPV